MSEREIILSMSEPTSELGDLQYVQIGRSPRFLIVTTGGTLKNTGQLVALLREAADALEADACGQSMPYADEVPPGQVRGGEVAVGGSDG